MSSSFAGGNYFITKKTEIYHSVHQLPIYNMHKDQMVVLVSPRGLEMSHVVIIGYNNSPPYTQQPIDLRLYLYLSFVEVYVD